MKTVFVHLTRTVTQTTSCSIEVPDGTDAAAAYKMAYDKFASTNKKINYINWQNREITMVEPDADELDSAVIFPTIDEPAEITDGD